MRLRGLLVAAAAGATLALALTGVVGAAPKGSGALFSVMNGAKEVSAEGEKGVGDPDGRGSFSAIFDGDELCYGMAVKNIADPVAAHIHRGGRNVAGPVVQALEHPTSGDPGASSACVELTADVARAIRRNPAGFYVNVHTGDFPGGAVRGQLFAKRR
jgi:hypothetical protein